MGFQTTNMVEAFEYKGFLVKPVNPEHPFREITKIGGETPKELEGWWSDKVEAVNQINKHLGSDQRIG